MARRVNYKNPKLVKMFDSLSGSKGSWEVWNDVITMMAISLSNQFDNGERKTAREKRYLDIAKKYTASELQTVVKICAEITIAIEDNPDQDLLGDLYMALDFGSDALGQFFTPYHLCKAMAELNADKTLIEKEIEENGYIRVNEPSCGAGANIIAFANQLIKQGINYQTCAFFIAQDLSQLTALMCYIQMSLIGMAGIVIVGDTLQQPQMPSQAEIETKENIWLTPMYNINIWSDRRMFRMLDEML
jgi:type I restriction-modification system DNA methylase subunit